ncbi:NUDIX domain-containing protein [Bradyrhizobium japonicum]|uniref:NUDIX domain-containing protein n=1 Tax=Bradyrhizobium japonicum TaxID=375 RepID=UPI000577CB50|nr:NUDIX domain-containing protein [Bradyrhizobium japonicum]
MPTTGSSKQQSAGILLFRRSGGTLQVLLGHPGGPFWRRKDRGAWTIPKGLVSDGETLVSAARREFAEETGHGVTVEAIGLGEARQPSGKVVHVWAASDDWDAADLRSNTFEMEWPPRSGRQQTFPEIDRVDWFEIAEARSKILKGKTIFLDRLLERLGEADGS